MGNGKDQPMGKWEASQGHGLVNRLKRLFSSRENENCSTCYPDTTRGTEWIFDGDGEVNEDTPLRTEPTDVVGVFGKERCNSTTEVSLGSLRYNNNIAKS